MVAQPGIARMGVEIDLFPQVRLPLLANAMIEQGQRPGQGDPSAGGTCEKLQRLGPFIGGELPLALAEQVLPHVEMLARGRLEAQSGEQPFLVAGHPFRELCSAGRRLRPPQLAVVGRA